MDNPEIWIALVVVGFLVFGAKRMPDAARGLGRSLRIFKAETKGLMTDEPAVTTPAVAAPQPVYAAAPAAAPVAVTPVVPVTPMAPAPVVPIDPLPAAAPVAPAPAAQQPDAQ